jgi:hypothetical protein
MASPPAAVKPLCSSPPKKSVNVSGYQIYQRNIELAPGKTSLEDFRLTPIPPTSSDSKDSPTKQLSPQATALSEERPPLQRPVSEAVRKYSPETLQRRRQVLDEYAAKINGPVLAAFRYGRKVWDEWNNSQISPQILAERAAEFKKEAIAAFEQIDELWRIYRFDYQEIIDLPDWTYEVVIGKTNLLIEELTRFARFSETDARAALTNNRFVEDWYTGLNEFDQWIIAKRKLIAEKRKEYENVEASGAQSPR